MRSSRTISAIESLYRRGRAGWQSQWLRKLVDVSRFAQLDQHDVIINQPGLVVGATS